METTPFGMGGGIDVRRYYRGIDDLLNRRLDGGDRDRRRTQSRQSDGRAILDHLRQRSLTGPGENTVSSVCSCLAVHGAVLHLDGVTRHKLPTKCFGVFAQTRSGHHPLMQGCAEDLPNSARPVERGAEEDLSDCGYSVLTWSAEAGADCFVKQQEEQPFRPFPGPPRIRNPEPAG